jgi:hypothetical protein
MLIKRKAWLWRRTSTFLPIPHPQDKTREKKANSPATA